MMNFAIRFMAMCVLVIMTGCASLNPIAKKPTLPEIPTDIYSIQNIDIPAQEPLAVVELPVPIAPLHERATVRLTDAELQCVAQAMYREARGEGKAGMAAVGYVILNRMASRAYPKTACDVVHQRAKVRGKIRCQFSWSCTELRQAPMRGESYAQAKDVAFQVLTLQIENPIDDSVFFNVTRLNPKHTSKKTFRARIGGHNFFAAI